MTYDVVIVGGGAAGLAVASSLLARNAKLAIALAEPAEEHFYQPGWTFVGAGVFTQQQTRRPMSDVMPLGVTWLREAAAEFLPECNQVRLLSGKILDYRTLVVAPGLKLAWDAIPGLQLTLGQNGVTSNYRYDLAPYTHQLVQNLKSGRAIFTQPPMPIKCAGAPQKAMYLSCDIWAEQEVLKDIQVEFDTAGAVLFGVPEFVPPLMKYVERYGIDLRFSSNLVRVDGPARTATFKVQTPEGTAEATRTFDMLHVVPPQVAPDVVRTSALANEAGWVDVDQHTLRHARFENVYSLGDASSAPNAKTAAAVRKQAPVAALNILATLGGHQPTVQYDGYGSCPLTVERGKIVLAEFGYGGKLLPSFPKWFIDGTRPSRLAWNLKKHVLPPIYWDAMLKGREWLARPALTS